MKSTIRSFLITTLSASIILIVIAIPVFANWASTVTQDDSKVSKMWINLAGNGYAELMKICIAKI